MLETAPLQPWSSLLLLEVDALAPMSSEVFRASAGLHEAETLVLQPGGISNWPPCTEWFYKHGTLILLSCSPTSPRPTNGVGAFWPAVAAPFPHHHPPAGPAIPVEGRGKILGGRGEFTRGADKYDLPAQPLLSRHLHAHLENTRGGGGGFKTHL